MGSASPGLPTLPHGRLAWPDPALLPPPRDPQPRSWGCPESPSPPSTPEQPLPAFCLHYFDMLYPEDTAWATKGTGEVAQSSGQGGREEARKEPEQCPIIDSQGLGLGPDGELQDSLHLEEVQSMVLGEVLKDIETACKLLNIAAGGVDAPHRMGEWFLRGWSPKGNGSIPSLPLSHSPAGALSCSPCSKIRRGKQISTGLPLGTGASPWDGAGSELRPFPLSASLPVAGGDTGWADSEVDSSCAGQPIHLWQFLKELLLKPHNYGRFIRWLNKDKGIFKIEDSAQVARLWGIRKNRPAMNYDKLSRSIRQYYKKGIIRKPDISQRLVYQFVHPV
uniref:SAM pointed domain containing ETS transcription factor n=1 Tax=Taeniopygia guttata TaxID=59729 RepID=H0YU66_TAEGU